MHSKTSKTDTENHHFPEYNKCSEKAPKINLIKKIKKDTGPQIAQITNFS
jgi:hypothetical protein